MNANKDTKVNDQNLCTNAERTEWEKTHKGTKQKTHRIIRQLSDIVPALTFSLRLYHNLWRSTEKSGHTFIHLLYQ